MTSPDDIAPESANAAPAVAFVTLGCPKNEVDTDVMAASLPAPFRLAEDADEADVLVVNTCAFIEAATEESIEVILDLAEDWRAQSPGRRLVVAGCMPSRYGDDLASELPEVDAFVPVAEEGDLAAVLTRLLGVEATGPVAPDRTAPGASVYVQISDGCHRACAFCTIPSIRGTYRSRPLDEILAESLRLASAGASEIVLVGQDTSSWGRDLPDRPDLADLVRALSVLPDDVWVRLMYVQPDGITPDLLDAMASTPQMCRYLDMPVQHASHEVLHAMRRTGSGAEYLRLIGVVRDLLPGVALRTTVIAGFPGETEEEVQQLEAFLEDAGFDYVGVFPYSPEEGTVAAELPGQLGADERIARAQRLRDVADAVGIERSSGLVGTTVEVLSEGLDEDGAFVGRHRGQAPEVDGIVFLDREVPAGTIVDVRVTDSVGYDLHGEVT